MGRTPQHSVSPLTLFMLLACFLIHTGCASSGREVVLQSVVPDLQMQQLSLHLGFSEKKREVESKGAPATITFWFRAYVNGEIENESNAGVLEIPQDGKRQFSLLVDHSNTRRSSSLRMSLIADRCPITSSAGGTFDYRPPHSQQVLSEGLEQMGILHAGEEKVIYGLAYLRERDTSESMDSGGMDAARLFADCEFGVALMARLEPIAGADALPNPQSVTSINGSTRGTTDSTNHNP